MKLLCRQRAAIQIAMMLACTATFADGTVENAGAPPDPREFILVNGTRDPVNKSYRKMLNGVALFEKMHAMAPNASLLFKLLPRQYDTKMDGIVLEIIGDTVTVPVPLAADRTFTLEYDQQAADENAAVMPNRRASSMTWRTEIRTPGLPPNTRRLGDLRLECRVGMEAGLISNTRPVIGLVTDWIQGMLDFCNGSDAPYLFFADRPLFSVSMSAGARREILSVDELYAGISNGRISKADLLYCDCQVLLDRSYFLPLGDRSWPDDTLIEFEFMDDGNELGGDSSTRSAGEARGAITIGKSTKAEVIAAFGKTAIVSFDSGFEVWIYQVMGERVTAAAEARTNWLERILRAGSKDDVSGGRKEYVVLFSPSGVVANTRIRPAPMSGAADNS